MSKKGIWLLPTRGRPVQLQRVLDACIRAHISTPGLVLVESMDYAMFEPEYSRIILPRGWLFSKTTAEGYAAKCQETFSNGLLDDYDWVGVIADDNTPQTDNFDILLGEQTTGWNIVSSNDCWQAPTKIHGATIWSLPLIKAVGYFFPPGLIHMFADDIWETIGRETGILKWDMSVIVRHDHIAKTGKSDKTSQQVSGFMEADERVFSAWRCFDRDSAVRSTYELMKSHGVVLEEPDLSAFNLMLATPVGRGSYVRQYVKSLINTVSIIRKYGGHIEWVEIPECADIAAARALLLGTFYRGVYTHLLYVDDDMGWRPVDVIRMLLAKRDFLSIVGMKKCDDPLFAFDNTASNGVPSPLMQEGDTGLMTGEHLRVGSAFVMLTRDAVKRMIQAYPELKFDDGRGNTNYALFDPIVKNGSRKPEDYSFCDRWRAIGGRIYIMPDATLEHIGNSVWSGNILDYLRRGELS